MNELRENLCVLVRLALVCQLAPVFTGCASAWHQAKTCCPVYNPTHYLLSEESPRVPPCGPDALFHGLKKTGWRDMA